MAVPEKAGVFRAGGSLRRELLSAAAEAALEHAARLTRETRRERVQSTHLFMGLLAEPDESVQAWGRRLRANLPRLLEQFRELVQEPPAREEPLIRLHREFVSDNVIVVLREAYRRALAHGRPRVTPLDILISVLGAHNSPVAECFERIGIPAAALTKMASQAERARRGGPPGEHRLG